LVVALSALGACGDPGQSIDIYTDDADGNPVPGVALELDCPAPRFYMVSYTKPLGTTNGMGTYSYKGLGETAIHCKVRPINAVGASVPVQSVCRRTRRVVGTCVDLAATLVVSAPKP
jgi:hypothetical protein